MARYFDSEGNTCNADLLRFDWEIRQRKSEQESNFILVKPYNNPLNVLGLTNESLIQLHFQYSENDPLKFYPLADYLICADNKLELDQYEKEYFTDLLQKTIGDHHSPEMQKTFVEYHNAVDPVIVKFVHDVMVGRNVEPITVGFVSSRMGREIKNRHNRKQNNANGR